MTAPQRRLYCRTVRWPLREVFTISRSSVSAVDTVVIEIAEGEICGRGECRPYPRYGEAPADVIEAIRALEPAIASGLERDALQDLLPAGAARNAIDCALWDLEAKLSGTPVHRLAGLPAPRPLITAYTLSLDTPERMAEAAHRSRTRPLLKVKLGGNADPSCIAAVREAAPLARLIVDANEGWTEASLDVNFAACLAAGVLLVEQPLPAGADDALMRIHRPVPVCADESLHDRQGLSRLRGRYDAVNVKLDKTGGLTEALQLIGAARDQGFAIMVGCMVASSLAMAPAVLAAQAADFVDLDGPLLLAADDPCPLHYEASLLHPPSRDLWG